MYVLISIFSKFASFVKKLPSLWYHEFNRERPLPEYTGAAFLLCYPSICAHMQGENAGGKQAPAESGMNRVDNRNTAMDKIVRKSAWTLFVTALLFAALLILSANLISMGERLRHPASQTTILRFGSGAETEPWKRIKVITIPD